MLFFALHSQFSFKRDFNKKEQKTIFHCMIAISRVLYSFVSLLIAIWYYFLLAWRISFNISWNISLLAINSFCISEKNFYFTCVLERYFHWAKKSSARHWTLCFWSLDIFVFLGWKYFFFSLSNWEILPHCILACIISHHNKTSDVSLTFVILPFFPLAAFNIFHLFFFSWF